MQFHSKKSLGQNFLKSKGAVREIISAGGVISNDTILEIGPGKGILTEQLLQTGAKVVAVEKDDRLTNFLKEKFADFITQGKFEFVNADILEFNPSRFMLHTSCYKLVANIPYYITGEVIRQFLTNNIQPKLMVLMVQKEVAQRICSKDGKESILSISVKAYGNPKYINTIKAKFFSPIPRVDSAILLIDDISKKFFDNFDEKGFFDVVKAGFAHKRKFLVNNLEKITEKQKIVNIFDKLLIPLTARAETITLAQWKDITFNILST
ncbi:MAG: 16S rRNA (adenine(1518)-N(6)/adenine(1519)-N(6))-dimethyltransferase RsmA [Patescibacteria group bacterium]|nr:16S rRNA (adenine(1518)-N(6)/adenine(1519)-N(6))-dimethyltransferase RsmA [Patescibacteria group bacterium]